MSYPDAGRAPKSSLDLHTALADLRRRAESRYLDLQKLPADASAEVQQLVQKLEVQQLELELQHEELLLAQAEAEASRAQYADLYEFAPVGYCSLAADSELLHLNSRVSQLLDSEPEQLLGRRLLLFVAPAHRHAFTGFLQAVFATGQRQVTTLELLPPKGSSFWGQLEGVAATDGQGRAFCRLALLDVTEQYQSRRELELSEQRFRTLFQHNKDGMLLLRDNHFVDCNSAALTMLELSSKEQLLHQHASACSPQRQPDGQLSYALANRYWEEAMQQGFCRYEWCRQRTDGSEFWQDVLLTAISETNGQLVHASWRDITTQKEAAHRLRVSEERLQQALDASDMGVWTNNQASNELYWDARAQAIFGRPYTSAPASFDDLWGAIHPDDQPVALLLRQLQPGQSVELECRITWPDKSIHYVSIISRLLPATAISQAHQLTGLIRDITPRRQAELELASQNRLLTHILSHLPVVMIRVAPDGHILEITGAGLQRMGIANNWVVGHNLLAAFPAFAQHSQHLLAGEQVSFVDVVRHHGKTYSFQKHGFFDQQRQQAILFSIDITEVERQRALLQAERDFTKNLLDSSIDIIVAFSARPDTYPVTAWNQRAAQLTGIKEAEALGRPLFAVLPHLRNNEEFDALLAQVLAGTVARYPNWAGQHFTGFYDLNLIPLAQSAARPGSVLFLARDVTERHKLQAETMNLRLRQQQEVLSAILITQEEERRRIAEGLHNGVGQLLYATRLHLNNLPPTEAVHTTQKLLDDAIRSTRSISFELTPGILEDFGLALALHELVKRIPTYNLRVDLNLSGLREPLPSLLETAVYRIVQELLNNVMKHARAQEVFVQVARADGHLYVSVEDDGVGFDTARAAAPRGIGLSGIQTRVSLLGGSFDLRSAPGRGTSITLTLPVDDN